ncbi:TadE/TadG family type IV pilus assembly protein [Pseudonocardia sp. MH-G8]|uniref:TadE/TadG family type IV pilus assembly protein n=1 Tax=Pseudonocardia sp. MH-G8 TaxID=1854588 RepID=UPI000BA0D6C5|nr:TadE/TadG family type IV pilus assembly protein [Pseudonocardia sp. MH-G8]OZM77261.1 pilus assembly protein TadE [Pseudonocardia sp. MH-G8]
MRIVADAERGGGPATEAAILAVVVGLLLAFAMAAGRLAAAESAVDHAARSAARLASVQRDLTTGQAAAEEESRRVLEGQGLACDHLDVAVEAEPPSAPIGVHAVIRARVTCAVRWSDLGLPGLRGGREVTADFASPIDRYRERT